MATKHSIAPKDLFATCIRLGYPVALYRLPGESTIRILVQSNGQSTAIERLEDSNSGPGFIFHPFQPSAVHPIHFIQADIYGDESDLVRIIDLLPNRTDPPPPSKPEVPYALSQQEFEQQVSNAIKAIRTTALDKVIQFRVQHEPIDGAFEATAFFKSLCSDYPSAFCYMLSIPGAGTWMGASPEKLFTIRDSLLETVALAATQSIAGRSLRALEWNDKEREEQEVVAQFIESILRENGSGQLETTGPNTVAAGKIAHISTQFKLSNFDPANWTGIARRLHPTPAIGGLPQNLALEYIRQNEMVDRSYYSGYLGPVHIDHSLQLYVNIRCLQIFEHTLALYAGCGITRDSEPKKEFLESYHKTLTLLNVLQKNYDL